jgi:protein-S-isoprenylcysteine O-methyltransferase Ste14
VQCVFLWAIVAAVVVGVLVFVFTQDMSLPMGWVDRWTIVNVVILVVEIIVLLFAFKGNKLHKKKPSN